MERGQESTHPGLRRLLETMVSAEASDLHMVCGYRPTYRVHGRLHAAEVAELDDRPA